MSNLKKITLVLLASSALWAGNALAWGHISHQAVEADSMGGVYLAYLARWGHIS